MSRQLIFETVMPDEIFRAAFAPLGKKPKDDALISDPCRDRWKRGFMVCGHIKGFAGARGADIEEVMRELRA